MKQQLIFTIIFFCVFSHLYASDSVLRPEDQKKKKHYLGCIVGPNISYYHNPIYPFQISPAAHFSAGITYMYDLQSDNPKHLLLRTGLIYSGNMHNLGSYDKTNNTGEFIKHVNEGYILKEYLLVPLYLRWYISKYLFLNSGFYAASLLSVHIYEDGSRKRDNNYNYDNIYDNLEYGVEIGFGYDFSLRSDMDISFSYSFQYVIPDNKYWNKITHTIAVEFNSCIVGL